ncbi:hypothetical protein [Roseinatronobacter sp. S2]|uniref:hypothetical protein n=1 Tax=Roseinatronobacter sp. S2 TaxID=3035471 RepID=UPI00241022D5|nr:hypothetical protein [Roseinatronobacter sp. S2]WFE76141.1 hypothetical protein P8S53_06995 [Roseinatronobacter sp. S2]
MNSQIIIRGTAIAIAGIAASIFAAKEFIGDPSQPQPQAQTQSTPQSANGTVVGASLIGAGSSIAKDEGAIPAASLAEPDLPLNIDTATTESADSAKPELILGALEPDLRGDNALRLDADFRPELALAEASLDEYDEHHADCSANIALEASVDALLNMRLSAPCNASQRVVISHGDLAFSAYTDEDGAFSAYIPALAEDASVDAFLEDGTLLQASTTVPDVTLHHRVIVQWTGDFGLSLHAFHQDAAYGSSGHIHASRPFDPDLQEAFVISLGETHGPDAMMAHIYSVPVAMLGQSRVELEAAHDFRSCGKDLSAYVLQSDGGQTAGLKELSLAMPDCGPDQGVAVIALPFEHAQHALPLDLQDTALLMAAGQD